MQPGDEAGVDVYAIVAPRRKPFIMARAALRMVGSGLVTVRKKADGYHIDCSLVPGVRFRRGPISQNVYRVKSVSGLACMS
jgi:hypothetical protein